MLFLDSVIPHLHMNSNCPEGKKCGLGKSTMLVLAVSLHNLPEGMAVGVVLAGMIEGGSVITAAGALTLAAGIAIFRRELLFQCLLWVQECLKAVRFFMDFCPAL